MSSRPPAAAVMSRTSVPPQQALPGHDRLRVARNLITPQRLASLLTELVAIPSGSGHVGEAELLHLLQARLARAGLATDCWPVDLAALRQHPRYPGEEVLRTEAWGLVGATGGEDGPTLMLTTHLDVTPTPAILDASRLVVERGEDVMGPGTVDAKAALACQILAVESLLAAGVRLRGRVLIAPVMGGEDSGFGMLATLQQGYVPDAAVVGLPTENHVVHGCAGSLGFRIHLSGAAGPGTAIRHDLLTRYLMIHEALGYLETSRSERAHPALGSELGLPILIGALRSGTAPGTAGGGLCAYGRITLDVHEDPLAARAELESVVHSLGALDAGLRERPAIVEWLGAGRPGMVLPPDAVLPLTLANAHAQANPGTPASEPRISPRVSDLSILAAHGVAAVGYGPGDPQRAHAPGEAVSRTDMLVAARTILSHITSFCGTY